MTSLAASWLGADPMPSMERSTGPAQALPLLTQPEVRIKDAGRPSSCADTKTTYNDDLMAFFQGRAANPKHEDIKETSYTDCHLLGIKTRSEIKKRCMKINSTK